MVKRSAEKSYGGMAARTSGSELSENKPRQNFRLGDITWVKHGVSSWWPAQVIDEASVSSKPKKKTSHDALVRFLYVDPWKSNMEFEMILKEENKTAMEAFHKVLQKELTHFKSPSDHDEEPVSKKAKTSVKKVTKREGLKRSGHGGVKESGTTQGLADEREHQYGAEQDKEIGINATTGLAVRERRSPLKGASQASALDKFLAMDKAWSDDSAEGLKDKTHKKASVARDKKGGKMESLGTPVVGKEGSSRSGRTSAKEYLDASDDSTSELHDTSASEDVTEAGDITSVNRSRRKKGSVVDGTHREIKVMVRDILLGDIIFRQHAAEMAYVDEVIFGICDATGGVVTHGSTADAEGGRSIKRTGGGLEADSCNAAKRHRKGRVINLETKGDQNTKGDDSNSSPSRGAAMDMEGSEQHSARQIKIMQKLGLVAPPGSPFKGLVAATQL